MNSSISIFIPAFNEAKNITEVISNVTTSASKYFSSFEIIVVDDGSSDNTCEIVRKLQKNNPHIVLFENERNQGLGYCFKKAILNARNEFFCWFPGDNDVTSDSVDKILSYANNNDIIITYLQDDSVRSEFRQKASRLYTEGLNIMFGLDIKYYNGIVIYKTEMIKDIKIGTSSFGVLAEILIPILLNGASYKQYPFSTRGESNSNMIKFKNTAGVLKTISILFIKSKLKLIS